MRLGAVLALAFAFLTPCGAAEPQRPIRVDMDPALELLGITQLLADQNEPPHGFVAPDINYARAARKRFETWRGHAAVRSSAALDAKNFDFMKRGDVLERLTPPPDLAPQYLVPDSFLDMAGGKAKMAEWLAALRDFSHTSPFLEFFAEQQKALQPDVAKFRLAIERKDYIGKIERYTGLPFSGEYSIHLSPFFKKGSMVNAVIRLDDGSYVIKTIEGPEAGLGGTLDYGGDSFDQTAWHELSHGVVDILSDLSEEEIARSQPIKDQLPWECYNDWKQCVKENMVRAVMIRLIALDDGERAGDKQRVEEGEKKYPYMKALLALLREYESSRDKYPTLAQFYPRLLTVFPQSKTPAAVAAAPAPAPNPGDPGPEWAMDAAGPFPTDGQRGRAVGYLDKLIAGAESADYRIKRGALELLLKRYEPASSDAGAALALRPESVGALLIRASAEAALGKAEASREDLSKARSLCGAGAGPAAACDNVARLLGGAPAAAKPATEASGPKAARGASSVDYSFEVDPRVELLSVVWQLSKGDLAETPAGTKSYISEVRKHFTAYSGHPVVSHLARLLKRGTPPMLFSQLLLGLSEPPALAPAETLSSGEFDAAGGEAEVKAFLDELRDFAKRSGFMEFYAARKPDYDGFIAIARREERAGQRVDSAEDYLKTKFAGQYRFILAPTLPVDFDANVKELRMRSEMAENETGLSFSFEDFAATVTHELVHTVTDPLVLANRDELAAYASLNASGCADSWIGCVMEHVDIAVTLRMLARTDGDPAYERMLRDYTGRGFPYLTPLCDRLRVYEKSDGTFEAFFPQLVEVFRELLVKKIAAQAANETAATAEAKSAGSPPPAPPELFSVDPRSELLSVLLTLSAGGSPAAGYPAEVRRHFSAWSAHPAVALADALARSAPGQDLAAQLLFYVSDPPELALTGPIPEGYLAQAGGRDKVDAFFAAARDFAQRSDFSGFFNTHRNVYRGFVDAARREARGGVSLESAAAYLGNPSNENRRFVLCGALTPDRAGRISLITRDGSDVIELRPASYSRAGLPSFGFDSYAGSAASGLVYDRVNGMMPAAPAPSVGSSPGLDAKENIVSAVMERLQSQRGARAPASGMPYAGVLSERLKEYEANRDRYKSLADFYPRLAEVLSQAPPSPREDGQAPRYARGVSAPADSTRIEYMVDPRVELYSVLRLISPTPGHARSGAVPTAYREDAERHFSRFAHEPAVAAVDALVKADPQGNLALRLMFRLSAPPELARAGAIPEDDLAAAGGRQKVEDFFGELRRFAKKSDFRVFFDGHAKDYAGFVAIARGEALRSTSVQAAAAYLGARFDADYVFPLAVLLPGDEAGNFTMTEAGRRREIRLRGASGADAGGVRFMFDMFGDSTAHELIHTVTNPLVADSDGPSGPAPKGCNDQQPGGSWSGCIQEHLVYAVTLRLMYQDLGETPYREALRQYQERGFPYLPALCERLKEYEAHRDLYHAIAAFYPRLREVFGEHHGAPASPAARPPRLASGPEGAKVRRLKDRGVAEFSAGRYETAAASFSQALAIAPADVEALEDMGVLKAKTGAESEALKFYDRAIAAGLAIGGPEWEHTAEALSSRAYLYVAKGRSDQARADLRKALELVPADWRGRAELARQLAELDAPPDQR